MFAESERGEREDSIANAGVSSEWPFILRFCQKLPLVFLKFLFNGSCCQSAIKDLWDAMLVDEID
jgi:hypothetical protein